MREHNLLEKIFGYFDEPKSGDTVGTLVTNELVYCMATHTRVVRYSIFCCADPGDIRSLR